MTRFLRFAGRLGRFLAAGMPAFAAALLTNFLLVEKFRWPKPAAYVAVLWLQTTINFFACRLLVFDSRGPSSPLRQYFHFLSGIGVIRGVEWVAYTVLVEFFHVYYLAVQVGAIAVFSIAKFKFAESLFERRRSGALEDKKLIGAEQETL